MACVRLLGDIFTFDLPCNYCIGRRRISVAKIHVNFGVSDNRFRFFFYFYYSIKAKMSFFYIWWNFNFSSGDAANWQNVSAIRQVFRLCFFFHLPSIRIVLKMLPFVWQRNKGCLSRKTENVLRITYQCENT